MIKEDFLSMIGDIFDESKELMDSGDDEKIIGRVTLLSADVDRDQKTSVQSAMKLMVIGFMMSEKEREDG